VTADDDPGREVRALEEALRDIIDARDGEPLADRPLASLLFAAVVGSPYEGAEADSPGVAVLRSVRASVAGWAHMGGDNTRCAAVPFVEIGLLTRRLDVAIEIVRRASASPPAAGGAS
jgi:hypothetical protein